MSSPRVHRTERSSRFRVPARAEFSVEHERGDGEEEVEFQLKWTLDAAAEAPPDGTVVQAGGPQGRDVAHDGA